MPGSLTSRSLMAGMLLACALLAAACTRNTGDDRALPGAAPSATPAPAPAADRYLYLVYCNGTVDRLDLVQRTKAGSLQLSHRSGTPAAVAALPLPGVRPGGCLARPMAGGEAGGSGAHTVHIVASSRLDPGPDGLKPYQLLTFALPAWTLQHAHELGSFDTLPRVVRADDGSLSVQPSDSDPAADMLAKVKAYAGAEALDWASAMEWSDGNVLLSYALPGQGAAGAALALGADARIVRLAATDQGSADIAPDQRLAPGGRFVLATMKRSVALGEGLHKVEATGQLRLYGADGREVGTWNQASLAGSVLALSQSGRLDLEAARTDNDWFNVALTPGGLAVFTDRRGNYQFIDLGRPFGTAPVTDPALDDADGARPALLYSTQ